MPVRARRVEHCCFDPDGCKAKHVCQVAEQLDALYPNKEDPYGEDGHQEGRERGVLQVSDGTIIPVQQGQEDTADPDRTQPGIAASKGTSRDGNKSAYTTESKTTRLRGIMGA